MRPDLEVDGSCTPRSVRSNSTAAGLTLDEVVDAVLAGALGGGNGSHPMTAERMHWARQEIAELGALS
jgi:hypothetical protein